MTRICIISDIHANLHALNKFLEYIDKSYNIEYILNLGDFVQNGPNPCEVFDVVMKDKRFINIMGNSEYELISQDYGDGEKLHEVWTIHELGEARMNMIKKLPLSYSVELYGKKIFMMHANTEFNNQMPSEYGLTGIVWKLPLDSLSEKDKILIINEHDYLLVALNHIQGIQEYIFKDSKYSFIQPGAIGCLDIGNIKFAILEIDENEENIIFKSLKYNSYEVIEDCIKKEVPDPSYGIYRNKIKEDKDFYDVSLSNKYNTDIIPMDFSFWQPLLKLYLEKNKYVEFCIWNNEEELLEELKRKLKIVNIKYSENTEEIYIKAEIDKNLKELLTSNIINKKGLIKWFTILIYNEKEGCNIFIEHYGCEIHLLNVHKKELEYIKSIINTKRISMDFR